MRQYHRTECTVQKAQIGTTKYGPRGLYTIGSFEFTALSYTLCLNLVIAATYSESKESWSSNVTVQKHLISCQRELNIHLQWAPMLVFLAWLIRRNLKANTINSYMSALRTIHLTKGVDSPALRPPIVSKRQMDNAI